MKKLLAFMAILSLLFTFTGCTSLEYESSSRIVKPLVKSAPLQGTWVVDECMTRAPGAPEESQEDKLMGMEVGFSRDSIVFGNYMWNEVVYKAKIVNTQEYFLHSFSDAAEKLDIKDEEIYVIQASSGEKFLYEFAKISDESIVVTVDSNLYYLKKTSSEFNGESKKLVNEEGVDIILGKDDESKELRSGVMLGLRIPQKSGQAENGGVTEEYRYQTYWVAFGGGVLRPVLTAPDIFLPRKDGFWRVKERKPTDNSTTTDIVYASRVASGSTSRLSVSNGPDWDNENGRSIRSRTILYVGNDYICFEDTYYSVDKTQKSTTRKELRTLPVDRMDDLNGVKLSDIAGENGSMAVEEALADVFKNSQNSGIKGIEDDDLNKSFALFRKTGHWFIKGRLNFSKDYPVPFTDFNLNLLPPSDMVAYDTLQVPWTIIKDRIPQAIDAYTSPNKDMALVLTRNSLIIYAINGNAISDTPMARLSIPEGSSVVMAEWGTGNYMKKWEKAFMENNMIKEVK